MIALGLATWRARLDGALWLPFFMPGVLLGIALIWLFNRPGLKTIYQSAAMVVLAYIIRYAALGWTTMARAARTARDRTLAEAASWKAPTAGRRCATFIGRKSPGRWRRRGT